jgi:hypothetical protein
LQTKVVIVQVYNDDVRWYGLYVKINTIKA